MVGLLTLLIPEVSMKTSLLLLMAVSRPEREISYHQPVGKAAEISLVLRDNFLVDSKVVQEWEPGPPPK